MPAVIQWTLSAENFRHNLSEEEEKEGKQYGDAKKMKPYGTLKVNKMGKDVVAQHDNHHVDKIIGDEYRCQCSFAVFTQLHDVSVCLTATF